MGWRGAAAGTLSLAWKYKSTRAERGRSGAGNNIMSRQKTTIFASLGGGRRCRGQAFFDKSEGRVEWRDTAIHPCGCRVLFKEKSRQPHFYLRVFGSVSMRLALFDIYLDVRLLRRTTYKFPFFTFTKVSCLHFGQYSGKLTSSVSGRTLSLVLFPHTGHSSHTI